MFGTTGSYLSPLMIQGNLNLVNYSEAPLSKKNTAFGWSCKNVEGISITFGPYILFCTIGALL